MPITSLICVCGRYNHKPWVSKNEIPIVECTYCGVRRVEKIDKEAYAALYMSGKYHEVGSDDLPHEAAGRKPHATRFDTDFAVAGLRLKKLSRYKNPAESKSDPDPYRLIDIGCANGAFMAAASKLGFEVEGVDLAKNAVEPGLRGRVRVGDIRSVGFQRRYADVITFNDSFEHFIDPVSALKGTRGILKRDGIVVIEIPDMGCLDALECGAAFKHIKPHEHLWYFTATQLRDLLEANGFTVIGMDVPISGKVTAYASPAATVEEIEILGPPGIGDIMWTLPKLQGIREKERPCRIKYVVCVEGETKLATRAKDFLLLCRWIDSVEFRSTPLPRDIGCEDPGIPRYELIANTYLEPGNELLEDWRPELTTNWNIGIDIPSSAMYQAQIRLGNIDCCAVFYMSSSIYNQVVARPDWTPVEYARLFIKLNNAGIKPVIIGASWDADYARDVATEIIELGEEPSKVWMNTVGKTPIALAMAYMQWADVVIGIANGLPMIATYSGKPSIILWPTKGVSNTKVRWGKAFHTNWIPPHIRNSGLYTPMTIGMFTVDMLFGEIMKKLTRRIQAKKL